MSQASAFLIAGPTASGKSALALDLAERVGGTIVNADSMQVYADLSIINARPSAADMQRVPHLLFGHVDVAVNYSVGHWLADATQALARVHATGRVPIFVGGTGLYFKALTQGLSAIPSVPETVRAAVRAEGAGLSPGELHAKLATRDPVTAANLRPSDPQRILRALEVFEATGQSLTSFQAARGVPLLDTVRCTALFLAPDRPALRARIDARFEAMLAAGAMREVEALMRRNLDPALPAMRAHGIPHLMRHLRGEISYASAIDGGQRDTRHYARRQFTFARHQLPAFVWTAPEAAHETLQLHALASSTTAHALPPASIPRLR